MARAAAQVHADVLDTLVRQGRRSVVRMLYRDVLRQWVRVNWGDAAVKLTPIPSLGVTEQRDLPAMMGAIAQLWNAGYLHPSQQAGIDDDLNLPPRDLTAAPADRRPTPSRRPAPGQAPPDAGSRADAGSAASRADAEAGGRMRLLDAASDRRGPSARRRCGSSSTSPTGEDVAPAVIAAAMHGTAPEAVAAKVGRRSTSHDRRGSRRRRRGPRSGPIFRYANLFDRGQRRHQRAGARPRPDDGAGRPEGLGHPAPRRQPRRRGQRHRRAGRHDPRRPRHEADHGLRLRSGASAGYWLASSAGRGSWPPRPPLGSIGVVMAVRDPRRDKGKDIEFVSSRSRRTSGRTRPPRAARTSTRRSSTRSGDVFVGAVARNRGVKPRRSSRLRRGRPAGRRAGRRCRPGRRGRLVRGHAGRDAGAAAARREGRRAQAAPGRRNGAGPDHGVGRAGARRTHGHARAVLRLARRHGRRGERRRHEQEGRPMAEQHTDTGRQPAPAADCRAGCRQPTTASSSAAGRGGGPAVDHRPVPRRAHRGRGAGLRRRGRPRREGPPGRARGDHRRLHPGRARRRDLNDGAGRVGRVEALYGAARRGR
jgi:hypothetical protein